jgi:hypothetical protein
VKRSVKDAKHKYCLYSISSRILCCPSHHIKGFHPLISLLHIFWNMVCVSLLFVTCIGASVPCRLLSSGMCVSSLPGPTLAVPASTITWKVELPPLPQQQTGQVSQNPKRSRAFSHLLVSSPPAMLLPGQAPLLQGSKETQAFDGAAEAWKMGTIWVHTTPSCVTGATINNNRPPASPPPQPLPDQARCTHSHSQLTSTGS